TIGVRGQLLCGVEPLANAEVKLWLLNAFPRPDTNLVRTTTDAQGQFQVTSSGFSSFSIHPAVRFYHRCNNRGIFTIPKDCQRVSTHFPSSRIDASGLVDRWYEMGMLNMETKQRGERNYCVSNPLRVIGY
ncbi:hypothetical protein PENTCL1PPCAC_16063, partial [Pristionchus entomophagus]